MSSQKTCPVCGASDPGNGALRCDACGFETAFLSYFASDESRAFWLERVRQNAKIPLSLTQAALADNFVFHLTGSGSLDYTVGILLHNDYYLVDGIYGETQHSRCIRHNSVGAHHTVTLMLDGTVSALGRNDFGQCEVSGLREIRQVIAATRCTYALGKDGRVQVLGSTGVGSLVAERVAGSSIPLLKGWSNIARLAYGGDHLAGLTTDGSVITGGYTNAALNRLSGQAVQLRGVKAIAAASGGCTLALLTDGTVRFLGEQYDARSNVSDWTGISCIAARGRYVLGLTEDGKVRISGQRQPGADDIFDQVAGWANVAAVACGYAAVAAVTADGQLLLAGGLLEDRRKKLLSAWNETVRPVFVSSLRG